MGKAVEMARIEGQEELDIVGLRYRNQPRIMGRTAANLKSLAEGQPAIQEIGWIGKNRQILAKMTYRLGSQVRRQAKAI